MGGSIVALESICCLSSRTSSARSLQQIALGANARRMCSRCNASPLTRKFAGLGAPGRTRRSQSTVTLSMHTLLTIPCTASGALQPGGSLHSALSSPCFLTRISSPGTRIRFWGWTNGSDASRTMQRRPQVKVTCRASEQDSTLPIQPSSPTIAPSYSSRSGLNTLVLSLCCTGAGPPSASFSGSTHFLLTFCTQHRGNSSRAGAPSTTVTLLSTLNTMPRPCTGQITRVPGSIFRSTTRRSAMGDMHVFLSQTAQAMRAWSSGSGTLLLPATPVTVPWPRCGRERDITRSLTLRRSTPVGCSGKQSAAAPEAPDELDAPDEDDETEAADPRLDPEHGLCWVAMQSARALCLWKCVLGARRKRENAGDGGNEWNCSFFFFFRRGRASVASSCSKRSNVAVRSVKAERGDERCEEKQKFR
eukprot:m.226140 g.226140  ORF g.226140 m.226140 type:complete len:419 (+) comp22356_c0_seq4:1632-2888(+)